MSVSIVRDAIHANVGHLPPGPAAGYTTGSPAIAWTGADWRNHPGAVRICQDPAASDHTADVLDVESGAATNASAPGWYKAALKAFQVATRPGQRAPAIYTSASNVTAVVNALVGGGVKSGPGLWVANWSDTETDAEQIIRGAAGPFPVIGFQYASKQYYDSSVFSKTWLDDVSAAGPFRHFTQDGDTVASLAASRSMKPESWLAEQGKLGADTSALGAGPLKAGTVWLSVNP